MTSSVRPMNRELVNFPVQCLVQFLKHWYLQKTKDYMLTYSRSDQLEIIGYFDSDYARCQDNCRSTSDYIYMLAEGAIS